MKILFFGTPVFAIPSLMELNSHFELIAVVTQPDKPFGRGLSLKESDVKVKAKELGIDVYQPEKLDYFKEDFYQLDPDISVVAAFGKIIPEWILNHKIGAVNIHASLLPKYRGAAPIQRAIINNEQKTGITIQKMVKELDAGGILSKDEVVIDINDTFGTLHDKLALASADLVVETLKNIQNINPQKQDENSVTWAPKVEKEEQIIDWNMTHVEIYNLIRALNPVPIAKTKIKGYEVKVWEAKLDERNGNPKQIIESSKDSFVVACGEGSLKLDIIQPANKNKIKGYEFSRNLGLKEGEII